MSLNATRAAAVMATITFLVAAVAVTAAESPLTSAREALAAGEPQRAVQIVYAAAFLASCTCRLSASRRVGSDR